MTISFIDWSYGIFYCASGDPVKLTPVSAAVNKIWEVTTTPEEITIKCNGVEVLHFIYNNSNISNCVGNVLGKEVTNVVFSSGDTAIVRAKFSSKIGNYELPEALKCTQFILSYTLKCTVMIYTRHSTMYYSYIRALICAQSDARKKTTD